MSKDFIKAKLGSSDLAIASKQQKNLSYFTRSNVQADIDGKMIEMMCDGKFGDDPLLSWVFVVFRKDNFRSFIKYLRFPLPSSRIVENEIVPQLERVFFSEDGFESYDVGGDDIRPNDVGEFTQIAFDALLYRYNDIVVHDFKDINKPFRRIINIDRVVSIESYNSIIERIAYLTFIEIDGDDVEGYLYMDSETYAFYDKEMEREPIEIAHDLGVCPADYVSNVPFSEESDIVRSSIFSRSRELMEEFVFLNTLRKMTDPNGAIPIVVKLASNDVDQDSGEDSDNSNGISASELLPENQRKKNMPDLQAGNVIELPVRTKDNGEVDTGIAENFLNFFRTPVESLRYLDERLKSLRSDIVVSIIGDHGELNDDAKNELQVSKSFVSKQDRLRKFGEGLGRLRNKSDFKMLALQYGSDRVTVDMSFGTDFFIESQDDLFTLLKSSPNPIERATILKRLIANRGRGNQNRIKRDTILYRLLPFASDQDFKEAQLIGATDEIQIQFQLRMQFFIGIFEATYGDIVVFWTALGDMDESRKLVVINELIKQIIKEHGIEEGFSRKDEIVQGE